MWPAILLSALAAVAQAGPRPGLDELIERIRREKDEVADDALHQVALHANAKAFEALADLHARSASAPKKRQIVHELRLFERSGLARKAIEFLRQVALTTADGAEGKEAVGSLSVYGRPGADALRAIARDARETPVRAEAIAKLAALKDEDDFPLFTELAGTETPSPAIRAAAIRAVGADPRGEALTRAALGDKSPIVRGAAMEARAKLRDPATIALAREVAADATRRDWSSCIGAIVVLRECGDDEAVRGLLAIGSRTEAAIRAIVLKALRPLEPAAVAAAAEAAAVGSDPGAALFAVEVLRSIADPAAAGALRRMLQSNDPRVVAAAARAIGARGDPGSLPDLKKAISNADPAARASALGAITDLLPADPEWRRRLVQFADDSDAEVRVAVAAALGRHAGEAGLPALERLLADPSFAVRASAVQALATVRSASSIPVLIDRLRKEDGRLREDAAAALRRISGLPFGRDPDAWERWWKAEGKRFVVPPLAEVVAKAKARAAERVGGETGTFFGLEVVSRRVAFVLDASGSMAAKTGTATGTSVGGATGGETRYQVALRELRSALDGRLRQGETKFSVVLFAAVADAWHESLHPLDEATRDESVRFAGARTPGGGTNLHDALERAFADPEVDTIYLLSDGEPSAGPITDATLLRETVREWNLFRRVAIHAVCIGAASPLMEGLAADSGGRFVRR